MLAAANDSSEMIGSSLVKFYKMEIDPCLDRPWLINHSLDRDDRRTVFALGVTAWPRKPVDEQEVWEISLTENWRPSLNVSAENFVLCRSVWLQFPNWRLWLHVEVPANCPTFY